MDGKGQRLKKIKLNLFVFSLKKNHNKKFEGWLIRYDGLACQFYIKGKEEKKQNIHAVELAER